MLNRTVREGMSSHEHLAVLPSDSVEFAKGVTDKLGVEHLLVMQRDRLVGVVCVCDFDRVHTGATVVDCLGGPPKTIATDVLLGDAVDTMNAAGISCLPVMDGARVVGILTRTGLRRAGIDSDRLGTHPTCASCGTHSHVREHPTMEAVGVCPDCQRRSEPPHWTEDLGRGA